MDGQDAIQTLALRAAGLAQENEQLRTQLAHRQAVRLLPALPVTPDYRFARRWSYAVWAIEGTTCFGAALTARLAPTTSTCSTCPRNWPAASGCSRPGTAAIRPGRALSVGIAAHTAARLNTAVIDEAIAAYAP